MESKKVLFLLLNCSHLGHVDLNMRSTNSLLQIVKTKLVSSSHTLHETNSEFSLEKWMLGRRLFPFGARPIFW